MESQTKRTDDRGREAEKPSQMPSRAWKDIAVRVKQEQSRDNLSIVAAGVAFYFILAMPPAIASAVSIYGLIADPQQVSQQLNALSGIIPAEAAAVIKGQLNRLVQQSSEALGLGMLLGLLLALWSANKGTKALITSLNIVYEEEEKRGFIRLNLWSLMLTVLGIVAVLVALSLLVALPALIGKIGLSAFLKGLLVYARWPLLALLLVIGLAFIYRLAPDRDQPQWRWVSWGSVLATVLWIIGSVLFSYYVSNFGDYNKTYGSMGAVIILMLWFFLSSYVILLGGEINAEMEHQTSKDTTKGKPQPMGQRRAYVADTVSGEKSDRS
ncbi:MAG: YihY/virulence factor BrkB family protein [Desulfobacteraceae bacterium]|nr:MAG: YihY/virulence factor BrkB family protein [Desulfobacteraceae bacterium]